MNFKEKYKKDNELIKLDQIKLEELSKTIISTKTESKKKSSSRKSLIAVATIIFCFLTYYSIDKVTNAGNESKVVENGEGKHSKNEETEKNDKSENNSDLMDILEKDGNQLGAVSNSEAKYYIPEPEISIDRNIQACYAHGFMVYKGKVYDENTSYKISLEDGKALMGEKLGVTWELGKSEDRMVIDTTKLDIKNTKDFGSIIGGLEVYSYRGYSDNFRLVVYSNSEYGDHLSIYENLSNMPLNKGADIFKRMNMKGNIKEAKWQTFEDWNYGVEEYIAIDSKVDFDNFIEGLYNAEPESLEDEQFRSQFFYKESESPYERKVETKFLYLKLKDGIEVKLRLFSNGYVSYDAVRGFIFKVNDIEFNKLWNKIR